jgi:hypothetical protein
LHAEGSPVARQCAALHFSHRDEERADVSQGSRSVQQGAAVVSDLA